MSRLEDSLESTRLPPSRLVSLQLSGVILRGKTRNVNVLLSRGDWRTNLQ